MANIRNVAATIHANMCEDSGFGYSWGERYGTWDDPVTWHIEGRDYTIPRGDYDCSSSVCTAGQVALQGTPYEGTLDGATYTGNMRDVFVNSGLFEVGDTNSSSAERGDVYLNDNCHTAMCQDGGNDGVYGYDCLSEFSINEFGEVYGGQRGDQNGGESHITGFYDYPWWCTLHYNGKADSATSNESEPEPVYTPAPSPNNAGNQPRYAVYTAEHGWLADMEGLVESDGGSDDYAGIFGIGCRYIGIDGVGKYRVCDLDTGWGPYVDHFDKNDEEYGYAGNGSTICALEIPNDNIKYQVHTINGEGLDGMIGNGDTGGSGDNYAGEMGVPIDAIRITLA